MTHVSEILDPDEFQESFRAGYIREQWHPTAPYRIYNYTEKAVFDKVWNSATLACRGLILDMSGNVIARPFPKFFNHGEEADPYEHVTALGADTYFDKLDGSLGILYKLPDNRVAVATRGSFTSEQAQWASMWLGSELNKDRGPFDGWDWYAEWYTPLVEIIYPENRIVLDYQGKRDLVLIGAVYVSTGMILDATDARDDLDWPGSVAEELDEIDLTRENREGIVVHHWLSGTMEKYKQEDYLALHKLVTNLNARAVYDALTDGAELADIVAPFPDEFHEWIREVAASLNDAFEYQMTRVQVTYEALVTYLNTRSVGWERRDFAAEVNENYPFLRAELFMTLDDNKAKLIDHVWRGLRPSADWRP